MRTSKTRRGDAAAGPRVLIVEDDPAVAEGLRRHLARASSPVLAASVAAAKAALAEPGWEAFLVDVNLPDGSGVELLGPIRAQHPGAALVLMTGGALETCSEQALVHRAMLVPKPLPARWLDVLPSWVRVRPQPLADLTARLLSLGLSNRETQLFVELATGATAELTALRFDISPATVRAHCSRVYTRLGASSLAEVIALAHGWIH